MQEIITGLISMGVGVLTAYLNYIYTKYRYRNKYQEETTLETRVHHLTASLSESVKLINEITEEISYRQQLVKNLEKSIETYNSLALLKKAEVDAVVQVLKGEFDIQSKKSFWQSLLINIVFFSLGVISTFVISYFV